MEKIPLSLCLLLVKPLLRSVVPLLHTNAAALNIPPGPPLVSERHMPPPLGTTTVQLTNKGKCICVGTKIDPSVSSVLLGPAATSPRAAKGVEKMVENPLAQSKQPAAAAAATKVTVSSINRAEAAHVTESFLLCLFDNNNDDDRRRHCL